jgi:methylglutaconyl-CoA hydratase
MPDFGTIEVAVDGPVGSVWLNRPRIHNAINAEMISELTEAFGSLDRDPAVRVVVLSGRGRSFCVGADLNWMREKGALSARENEEDALRLSGMLRALHDVRKPTLARVNGMTIGGGNGMVAACDLAVASEDATFRIAETRLGIVPAVISPYLFRRLGDRVCREIFLTARTLTAADAADVGLVNRVVPAADLDAEIEAITRDLLACGPEALVAAKELLGQVAELDLDRAQQYTAEMIARLRSSPEGREGMAAFFEKRPPSWVPEGK